MKLKKYRIISTKIERILWAIWKKGIVPINNVLNRKIFFSRHGVFFKRGRQVLQGAGCRWREAFCGVYAAKDGETSREKQPRGLCNIDKVQRRKGRKRGQIASQKEKNGRFAGIWANAGLFSMVFRQAPIY